jgi:hypothetical protein
MIRNRPFNWLITNKGGAKTEEFRGTMLQLMTHLRRKYGLIGEIKNVGPSLFEVETTRLSQTGMSGGVLSFTVAIQRLPYRPPVFQPLRRDRVRPLVGRQW